MGGLGHVAVQIAAAMGAEVTVLSQTLSKQEDGLRFGAKHYYATSEKGTFRELASSFDLILNTVSANLDIDAYLRPAARRRHAGQRRRALRARLRSARFSLIGARRSLAGSAIGGLPDTQEMLDFCAEHGVEPADRADRRR